MTLRYRLTPEQSRFTVHAFATGVLSLFAHSPTFAVREFRGMVRLDDGAPGKMSLEVVVNSGSLALMDQVKSGDRSDIEQRMRVEVLGVSAYPEILYEAADVASILTAPGRFRVQINGRLTLRSVTRPQPIDAELRVFKDGLQLQGNCSVSMSEFQIKPVTALGGAIHLRDALQISFELVGLPEAS